MTSPSSCSRTAPTFVGGAATIGLLLLKYLQHRGERRRSAWDQMRDLIVELRKDLDRLRDRAEAAERERDHYRAVFGPIDTDRQEEP